MNRKEEKEKRSQGRRRRRRCRSAVRLAATTSTWTKTQHTWRVKVQTQPPSLSVHFNLQQPRSLSHLVSLPKPAKSAWQRGSCESLSTARSATGMSNNAQRLRNTKLCVDLPAHRFLCNILQHLCSSQSLDLLFFFKQFFLRRSVRTIALISTRYTTLPSHIVRKKTLHSRPVVWYRLH